MTPPLSGEAKAGDCKGRPYERRGRGPHPALRATFPVRGEGYAGKAQGGAAEKACSPGKDGI